MIWVAVFAGVGALALVVSAVLALRLWRQGRALLHEVGELSRRADDFVTLVDALDTSTRPARDCR